jgi:hypothetical protein
MMPARSTVVRLAMRVLAHARSGALAGAGRRSLRRLAGPVALIASLAAFGAGAAPALAEVTVELKANATYPDTNQSVTFTAEASGDCGEPGGPNYVYSFEVDGGGYSTPGSSNTFSYAFSTKGVHKVKVDALDMNAGQCMHAAAEAEVEVSVNEPLSEGTPTASPSGTVNEGETVTLTAPIPSGGDPPFTYEWSYAGEGGPFTAASGQQISRRFLSNAKSQTTWVRVTDSASPAHSVVSSISTTVNPAAAQGGDIVQSPSGTIDVGQPVTYTAEPNGGVGPYTYKWWFNCGDVPNAAAHYAGTAPNAEGSTVTRTFSAAGKYEICLMITDAAEPPTLSSAGYTYVVASSTTVTAPSFSGESSCSSGQVSNLEFELTHVTGCLTKQSNGSYKATSEIHVNGVPITPASGTSIVITPGNGSGSHPGGQIGVELGQVALGSLVLYQGPISVDLPAGGKGEEKTFFTKTVKPVSLFGLKLGGIFTVNLGRESGGGYYSTFTLTIELPSIFKNSTGTGGITGTGSIKVDDSGAVEYNGAKIEASGAQIGPIGVKQLCFSLIPGGSSDVSSCAIPSLPESATGNSAYVSCAANPASGDHWDATAVIDLPTPKEAEISVFGGGVGDSLTDLGGFGTKLNIPIADDVFLNTIGAGFCFNTPLTIRGDVGVGMFPVPDKGDTVDINGTVIFTDSNPWSLALDGSVAVFGEQIGTGGVTIFSNGDFEFDAALKMKLAGFLGLEGGVAGWVQPSYKLFNVEGNVKVCISSACLGANGVVSSTGVAGCINVLGISTGAGYLWSDKQLNVMGSSCSVGAYQATKASIAAAGGARKLRIAPGTRGVAIRLTGSSGPPKIHISGPGGTSIASPAAAIARGSDYLLIEDPDNATTNVLLAHPKPGTYTITSTEPADPITGLQTAPVLAPFSGHGSVTTAHGGKRLLHLSYVLPQGATLSLVERGDHVENMFARNVRGKACPGRGSHLSGGRRLCLTTTFTPARGAGGERKIEAVVQRGGIPLKIATVARYRAPAQRPPAKPRKMQLVRHGNTVVVSWSGSAGAASYAVSARTSDGRSLSYTPGPRCRAVRIGDVPGNVKVSAVVEGVRYDAVRGRPAKATLKSRKHRGGAKGKLLHGLICHA